MVELIIWAPVKKTEREDRVKKALNNLFPTVNFRREGEIIKGRGKRKDIEFLKSLIWAKRILDTCRNFLTSHQIGDKTEILFNKQAAFAGKVSLVDSDEESPMGAIHVETKGNLEEFIDWFSPPTKDGKPILKDPSSHRNRR